MSSIRIDLHKRCFFVLSGVSNPLGKYLAIEMCRLFKINSVIILIDEHEAVLENMKKNIESLKKEHKIICYVPKCNENNKEESKAEQFHELLTSTLNKCYDNNYELAFILHNEGIAATELLLEPQDVTDWKTFVQHQLYDVVALNQQFINLKQFENTETLVVNITSSMQVLPIYFGELMGSCKDARNMYFRAMADYECRNKISVITYSPGIMETHEAQNDVNNNIIDLAELGVNEKIRNMPRVKPLESSLKLINILQKMSFISGHEVDYYDTYVL